MPCNTVSGFTITSEDRQSRQTREKPDPEQTAGRIHSRTLYGALHDSELVTQRNVLKLDSNSAFERR